MDLESALARLRTLAQSLLTQHRGTGIASGRAYTKRSLWTSANEFKGAYDIIGHLIGGYTKEQRRFEYRQLGADTEVHDMYNVYLAAIRKVRNQTGASV